MAFLDHIMACNRKTMAEFCPLHVAGEAAGWIRRHQLPVLEAFPDVFVVTGGGASGNEVVSLHPALETPQQRSEALAVVCQSLVHQGAIERLRNELFAVRTAWARPELFRIDRAAVSFFGLKAWGVHLNGWQRAGDGSILLWIGRRARDKRVAPGKLDNIVAGGQPAGLGIQENLLKEAAEEANIPASLALQARAAGAVTYCLAGSNGLKPDTLFCYDLEVPAGFVPQNTDGEVEGFELWPLSRVLQTLRDGDDFKFNVPLVILDFAIRHGVLTADNEPEFEAIVAGLRSPHP